MELIFTKAVSIFNLFGDNFSSCGHDDDDDMLDTRPASCKMLLKTGHNLSPEGGGVGGGIEV